jgi:hypothetical protein
MSLITVGSSSAEQLASVPSLIQNLGAAALYVDIVDTVTTGTGLRVESGDSIAVGGGHTYYGISTGSSAVRVLPGGTGGTATLSTTP